MPFSGGAFSRLYDWTTDRDAGVKIRADRMDDEMDGMATGLSTCILKDGTQTLTNNIPWGNFKITGLGAGSARTDSVRLGQVQDGILNWADGGGTVDAITATYSPAITTLVDGQICLVRATGANTVTTPSFSPNGLTARTIVREGGQALLVGDIRGDGHELALRYDLTNTRWELLNPRNFFDAMTTRGDIIYRGASAPLRLAVGTSAQVLKGGTDPAWGSVDGTMIRVGSDAQGDVLYFNGTNYVRLGAGTSGQFLKTLGAGANPSWADAGSTVEWVSTTTVSGGTEIAATGFAADYNYLLVIENGDLSADAKILSEIGTGAGPTYQTASYDNRSISNRVTSGVEGWGTIASTAYVQMGGDFDLESDANNPFWIEVEMRNPGRNAVTTWEYRMGGIISAGSTGTQGFGSARRTVAEVCTAWRCYPSTGTISGTIHVYRRKAS